MLSKQRALPDNRMMLSVKVDDVFRADKLSPDTVLYAPWHCCHMEKHTTPDMQMEGPGQ